MNYATYGQVVLLKFLAVLQHIHRLTRGPAFDLCAHVHPASQVSVVVLCAEIYACLVDHCTWLLEDLLFFLVQLHLGWCYVNWCLQCELPSPHLNLKLKSCKFNSLFPTPI